jgi:hypothetical protein
VRPQPRVKGITFRGLVGSIRRTLGEPTLERVLARLPPELAKTIRSQDGYISNVWYPLADYRALHAAVRSVTGKGPELARELSRQATLDDFRGFYRVLLSVLSPEFLLRRSPLLFSRFFDTGKMEVTRAETGRADAYFSGCVGFDRNIWEDAIGGCVAVLELCGAKDVQIRVDDGGEDGDEKLLGIATWH